MCWRLCSPLVLIILTVSVVSLSSFIVFIISATVLKDGLKRNFSEVSVSVVDCPDLTTPPWDLAAPGKLKNNHYPPPPTLSLSLSLTYIHTHTHWTMGVYSISISKVNDKLRYNLAMFSLIPRLEPQSLEFKLVCNVGMGLGDEDVYTILYIHVHIICEPHKRRYHWDACSLCMPVHVHCSNCLHTRNTWTNLMVAIDILFWWYLTYLCSERGWREGGSSGEREKERGRDRWMGLKCTL